MLSKWAKLSIETENTFRKAKGSFTSNHPLVQQLGVEWEYQMFKKGNREETALTAAITYNNEFFFNYESEQTYDGSIWKSKTTRKTNIAALPYKEEVDIYFMERNEGSNIPASFNYKNIRDGALKYELDFTFEPTESGFEATGKVSGIPNPEAEYKISLTAETDYSKSASFDMTSNIPGFESLQGKIAFQYKQGSLDVRGVLKRDDEELMKMGMKVVLKPYTKMMLKVSGSGWEQSVELMMKQDRADRERKLQVRIAAKGSLVEAKIEIKIKKGTGLWFMNASVEGQRKFGCRNAACSKINYDFNMGFSLPKKQAKISLEDVVNNLKHAIELSCDYENTLDAEFVLSLQSSLVPRGEIRVGWDLDGDEAIKNLVARAQLGPIKYEINLSGMWSPQESDITLTVQGKNRVASLEWKRAGLKEIEGKLTLNKELHKFAWKSDCDDRNNMRMNLSFQSGSSRSGSAELTFTKAQTGVVDVKGSVSLSLPRNNNSIEVTYSGTGLDAFEFAITKNGDAILTIKLQEKVDGKDLTVEDCRGRKVVISGNLHQFQTLSPDTELVLFVHLTGKRNSKTAQLTINREKKTLSFHIDEVIVVDVSVQKNSGGASLLVEGEGSALRGKTFQAKLEFEKKSGKEREVKFLVNYGSTEIVSAEAKMVYDSGKEFEYDAEVKILNLEPLSVELKLKKDGDEKEGELEIKLGEEKKLEVKAEIKPGEVQLEAEIDTEVASRAFLFKCDYSGMKEMESSLSYSKDEDVVYSIEFTFKSESDTKEFEVVAQSPRNKLTANAKVDLNDKTLDFGSKFNGHEMTLHVEKESDDTVSLLFASPIPGFTEVSLTGTIVPSKRGLVLEANGKIELEPLNFRAEFSRSEGSESFLSWRISKGAKQIKFKASASQNEKGKEVLLNMDVLEEHSEFRLVYGVEDTNFLTLTASFKTPVNNMRSGTMQLRIGYQGPRNLEFTATANYQTNSEDIVLFNLKNAFNYQSLQNVIVRSVVEIPALNIDKKGVEVVFQIQSRNKFTILLELSNGVKAYACEVSYERRERKIDFSASLKFKEDIRYGIAFGGERKCLGDEKGSASAYVRLQVSPTKLLQLQLNALVDIPGETFSATATLTSSPQDAIELELNYEHQKSLQFAVRQSSPGEIMKEKLSLLAQRDGKTYNVNLTLNRPGRGQRSVALLLDLSDDQRRSFELVVEDGSGQSRVRVKRQAGSFDGLIASPQFGEYSLNLDDREVSGILFLRINDSLHKITYTWESIANFSVTGDGPLIPGGTLILQVSMDPSTSLYHASLSAGEVSLLSGTLKAKDDQIFFQVEQNSVLFAESSCLSFMNNFRATGNVFAKPNKHYHVSLKVVNMKWGVQVVEVDANIRSKQLRASIVSPLLPDREISLSVTLSGMGEKMMTETEIKTGSHVLKASGHLLARSWTDFEGMSLVQLNGDSWSTFYNILLHPSTKKIKLSTISQNDKPAWVFNLDSDQQTLELKTPRSHLPAIVANWHCDGTRFGVTVARPNEAEEYSMAGMVKEVDGFQVIDAILKLPHLERTSATIKYKIGCDHVIVEGRTVDSRGNKHAVVLRTGKREKCIDFEMTLYKFNMEAGKVSLKLVGGGRYSIEGTVTTTQFSDYHTQAYEYSFALAFENGNRKTLKAYCQCPRQSIGLSFDYEFNSLADSLLEGRLSLPPLGLTPWGLTAEIKLPKGLTLAAGRGFSNAKRFSWQMDSEKYSIEAKWNGWCEITATLSTKNGEYIVEVDNGAMMFNNRFKLLLKVSNDGGRLVFEEFQLMAKIKVHVLKDHFVKVDFGDFSCGNFYFYGGRFYMDTQEISVRYLTSTYPPYFFQLRSEEGKGFKLRIGTPGSDDLVILFEQSRSLKMDKLSVALGEDVLISVSNIVTRDGAYQSSFTFGPAYTTALIDASSVTEVGSEGRDATCKLGWGFKERQRVV